MRSRLHTPLFQSILFKTSLAAGVLAGALTGCAGQISSRGVPSSLQPQGPNAFHIANLWWILFGLGTVIYLGVIGLLLAALFRRRASDDRQFSPAAANRGLVWAGLVFPAVVIAVVYGFTLGTFRAVSRPNLDDALTIEVVGRRWWWEVNYPAQQITTANEIYIPAGQLVQFRLTSPDVIHSFWVPQLHGKMDLNPGNTNTLWLQADQPGEYWGECAEFCGIQHAKMRFVVVAVPPDDFEAWLSAQSRPAPQPADETTQLGLQVFLDNGCLNCHTVRGTHATGELGPDLTHFASRKTIGAGSVENTTGHLGGWVADPHSIKPGNLMPATDLSGEQFNALLAYLTSLK